MLAHMTRFRSFAPAAVPALLLGSLALTACSDSLTPGSAERVSLSFAAAGPAATAAGTVAAVGGAGSTARVTVGSDEIVLTRVQLVMKEVELKLPDGVSTCGSSSSSSGLDDSGHHSSGSDDSSDDCDEI